MARETETKLLQFPDRCVTNPGTEPCRVLLLVIEAMSRSSNLQGNGKTSLMKDKKQAFASISKGIVDRSAGRVAALAALLCATCIFGSSARAQHLPARAQITPTPGQNAPAKPGTVFVKTALGGFILGYDIDQSGTEGLLAESLALSGGNDDAAIETFDQTTGKIIKVVTKLTNTKDDFVVFGVYGNGVGLVEEEKVKQLFVDQRLYATMFCGRPRKPLTRSLADIEPPGSSTVRR